MQKKNWLKAILAGTLVQFFVMRASSRVAPKIRSRDIRLQDGLVTPMGTQRHDKKS